ncbi:MAG: Mth938-like domain-containing protein [Methylotenera sp.]|nr:Mth938-like domain-containing protein [Methylotenera sp.]
MKLHLNTAENLNLITAYSDSYIEINKQRFGHSLIVLPQLCLHDWQIKDHTEIGHSQLEKLTDLHRSHQVEVMLLGTGAKQHFLTGPLSIALLEQGIAIECMSTAAACRTYNILMSEGRQVLAALIL